MKKKSGYFGGPFQSEFVLYVGPDGVFVVKNVVNIIDVLLYFDLLLKLLLVWWLD